jgi:hypothetical protein
MEIKTVAKYLKEKSRTPFELAPPTSKTDLEQMIRIYRSNGFAITGLFCDEIGASMFNHSCEPNAFAYITFSKCYIYARKPIKAGEEITINYVPRVIVEPNSSCDFRCCCGFFARLQIMATYEQRLGFLYTMIDDSLQYKLSSTHNVCGSKNQLITI